MWISSGNTDFHSLRVCAMLENDLQRATSRSRVLPVTLQLMVALRFYVTEVFSWWMLMYITYRGQVSRYSHTTLRGVSREKARQYIRMPTVDNHIRGIMQGFHGIAFPECCRYSWWNAHSYQVAVTKWASLRKQEKLTLNQRLRHLWF